MKKSAKRARQTSPASAKVLTFRRIVSRPMDPGAVIETVRNGLPASAIDEAVAYMEVSQKDHLTALRIPVSSFHRKLAGNETLSSPESEKVVRLADIARRAEHTF